MSSAASSVFLRFSKFRANGPACSVRQAKIPDEPENFEIVRITWRKTEVHYVAAGHWVECRQFSTLTYSNLRPPMRRSRSRHRFAGRGLR